MNTKVHFAITITLLLLALFVIWKANSGSSSVSSDAARDGAGGGVEHGTAFSRGGLSTNTDISSVPLDLVLSGTRYRDNIPALTDPAFVSVSEARDKEDLGDEILGIVVEVGETVRFYPYNVLVWHEIANDVVSGMPLTVTFCPLCGSAVVYEAEVDGEREIFGVSGKLFESNLLMYDKSTESLWSQILGEAVVGDRTGMKLTVYPSQLIPFGEFREKHSEAEVMSRKTGHIRNYDIYPYGNYENDEQLSFPVSVEDKRLPTKELMYIVNVGEQSAAFHRANLTAAGSATIAVGGKTLTATVKGSEIEVHDEDGNLVPGYFGMWFSWATHHQEDGVVWTGE